MSLGVGVLLSGESLVIPQRQSLCCVGDLTWARWPAEGGMVEYI